MGEFTLEVQNQSTPDGAQEHWPTPRWVTEALLARTAPPTTVVVEPSAGRGAMVRTLAEHGFEVVAFEVNPEHAVGLDSAGAWATHCPEDWLAVAEGRPVAGPFSVVMNPPYRPAETAVAHLRAALECGAQWVAALLPLSFLSGGSNRRALWRDHPLSELHFFSERPKFTESGGMFEPAWFVWDLREPVDVIPATITMLERR